MQLPPAITLLSKSLLGGLAAVLAVIFVLSRSVFYAEPGYVYHVRTILGAEHVVSDVGYQFFFFGRWNAWKRSLTVQAVTGGSDVMDYAEVENSEDSAALPPQNIMFLDQVDANARQADEHQRRERRVPPGKLLRAGGNRHQRKIDHCVSNRRQKGSGFFPRSGPGQTSQPMTE